VAGLTAPPSRLHLDRRTQPPLSGRSQLSKLFHQRYGITAGARIRIVAETGQAGDGYNLPERLRSADQWQLPGVGYGQPVWRQVHL